MSRVTVGALLLIAAGAILGCGGGGGDTAAAVSRAQFVKQANAICHAGEEQRIHAMMAVSKSFKPSESEAKQQIGLLLASLSPYEKAVAQLRELNPPKGEEETVNSLLTAMEAAAEQSRAAPRETLESSVAIFRRADEKLVAYGLDECDLIGAGSAG